MGISRFSSVNDLLQRLGQFEENTYRRMYSSRRTYVYMYVTTTHLRSIFNSEKLRIHIAFDKSVHIYIYNTDASNERNDAQPATKHT